MNAAFMFAGNVPTEVAEVMVRSVRRSIPGARVVQLTDMDSPQLPFVDEARRTPNSPVDWLRFRFQHQAEMPGDFLCIDYDCIVQRDVSKVFREPFDLAFTRRPENDHTASVSAREAMPHNLGVVFQRDGGRAFWREVLSHYDAGIGHDNWLAGQVLVSDAIRHWGKRFNLLELPGEYYNYTPRSEDEDVRGRAIVHYKGKRKHWMLKDGQDRAGAIAAGLEVDRLVKLGSG